MKQNTLGGLVVILFVCILAFSFGAICGTAHIGEEVSKEILPTSLTRSSDIIQVIDEKSFQPSNITVKFQTETTVKPVTKNTTYKNSSNTSSSNSSKKTDYDDKNNKQDNNGTTRNN